MKGLITDRTQQNVARLKALSARGWHGMTEAERKEWSGDPLMEMGVNLFPCGPFYSSAVNLKYRNKEIVATATAGGTYLYAISIVGPAENYANKIFTLSVDSMESKSGTPQISAYWHDDNGYEYAGASLATAGSVTFNTADFPNAQGRKNFALYVYVTTNAEVTSGAVSRFVGVMLENGVINHEYVPYTEILPTPATKGAYNYSDLNRVERAVAEISDIANLGLVTKTDWTMWDVPTESDMNRYLGNIGVLRTLYSSNISLPNSMANLTYETANNIEKIILAAYEKVGGN